MTNEHERTLRMKGEYCSLHEQGYSPKEIADKFHLSLSTVYGALQEIADKHGVTRESLLVIPHNTPQVYERKFAPVEPLHIEEAISSTKQVISHSKEVSKKIGEYLAQQEEGENA